MRKLLTPIGTAGCLIAVAACGSSSGATATSVKTDAALQLARCMRANGAPDFPDPGSRGGFQLNSQVNPQSPSFKAAEHACRRYVPNFLAPGTMSASQRTRAVNFARCMRSHGQPDFPDPTVGTATSQATGRVLALRGMFFEVGPGLDPKSPAFRKAAGDCGLRVPRE